MTVTQTLLCHPLNPEELNDIFYDIAKEHGWKPANVAHKLLWAFTSNGTRFLAAKNEATGEPLGYIIIPQHENASYIGYFIVRESKRGQGFGKQLFTKALEMATLEPVYLFSVENMIEKYKTMGFNTTGRKIGWYYTPSVDRSGLQTTPLRGTKHQNTTNF
jgi:predicted N-acetyltransferase YhbS